MLFSVSLPSTTPRLGTIDTISWLEFCVHSGRFHSRRLFLLASTVAVCTIVFDAQTLPAIQNAKGFRMLAAPENTQPTLRIVLPGHPDTDRSIEVIFPEHVTAKKGGVSEPEHLYLFRPGHQGDPVAWQRIGQSIQYERDFQDGIHFLARATLEADGVLFHYEFLNRTNADYNMIYAVTDPRLTGIFHDVRLERTYVHHQRGFDLLASETPGRFTLPLNEWLPARYLASFTWPVPAQRVERRPDGITYYNKARPVDEPMIATISTDRRWIVSSFARTTGNVWSNPELTCQHVDPETSLMAGRQAVLEVKILVFQGSLEQALQQVIRQRYTLK